ncbi:GntR family transcriptional regulator [Klenkia soli]|uniref:GntR family transcriptional regulator n=1 Tax=Klenkia soli TaxID=1052260 RepID=UPI001A97C30A|nr:GntR family transcriptional regulator [Klenkia soli]
MTDGARLGKADQVYVQLRAEIVSGVLAPGRTLPETELVAYTGASRTPVREAVRRLAAEGLIDLEPRRAPMVSRISLRSARQLFEFRQVLEPVAISMVATREVGAGDLRQAIETLLSTFGRLKGQEYSPAFQEAFTAATGQFDALLADHAPNEYLSRSILELRPHSARLRHIAHADTSRLQESIGEHIRMCQAVLDGQAEEAAAAMVEHLQHVASSIFRRLLDSNTELLVQ